MNFSEQKQLLKGVSYSFIGDKYETLELFEKELEEQDAELPDGIIYNRPEIKIVCEFLDEEDNDHVIEFVLMADNKSNFEALELLFKIHNHVIDDLQDNDFHFFEGLSLLQPEQKGKPAVYSLDLGN